MTSIIIVCWNNADLTNDCVASVQAYTPEEHEVIFIDNGSTDRTPKLLKKLSEGRNYKIITNKANLGYPKAINQGIEASSGDTIVFLNNDVIVSPEWLKGLLECLNHQPDIGIVGPRTNNISGRQAYAEGKYHNQFEFVEFARNFRKTMSKNYEPWWRIVGFCMLVKREVFDKVGVFDEQFSPGNFEDDDLCIRAILGGFKNFICNDVFVHHFGSASCKKIDFAGLLKKNQIKFARKWRAWQNTHNTISCCMIVKNEEKAIGKCLEGIIPLVDEVIVVDTGSTDRTMEILKSNPSEKLKVYEFEWIDDFSAARNFANSKATCDWIFSLDADEVISEIDRYSLFPVTAYAFETRNYCSKPNYKGWRANKGEYPEFEEGLGWFPSTKIRLYPNDKRLHWIYPVHEVIEPSARALGVERKISPIPVHHIGKFNADWDKEKGEKYYDYLKRVVADEPNDLRHVEELATQAQNLDRFDEAIEMWTKYLGFELDLASQFNGWLNLGHCYACQQKNKEALNASMKAWKLNQDSREAAMNVAIVLFRLKEYESARKISAEIMKKHEDYPIPVAVHGACLEKLGLTGG